MARWFKGFAVLVLSFIGGCDRAAVMKKITPPEDEAAARSYVELLRQNKLDQIEQDFDFGIARAGMQTTLTEMENILPGEDPSSVKVVGYQTFFSPDSRNTSVTLEYGYTGKWVLAEIATRRTGDTTRLTGFRLTPMADSLEHINRFTLDGKGGSQYTILTLAVLAPLFSLYALVLCIRTKMGKKKWLWLLLVLLGVGKLVVNWTTGQVFFTPLAFQVPPSGGNAFFYGPWQVYVSLPVGAIVFVALRKKLVVAAPSLVSRAATPQP